ncbi:MAG: DUF3307 domain-containing protein [Clostridia bacterium]|nr:DUF3307 domain-containing protein [Clostridia bacterium]
MAFQYLLLGHLLGDFLFQTDTIAAHKVTEPRWNLIHVALVTLCTLFFAIPLGSTVMLLVLANGIFHYVIDWLKPRLSKKYKISELSAFLMDQGIHVLLLFVISLFAKQAGAPLLFIPETWQALLVVVFVASFGAVLNQFIINKVSERQKLPFFLKDEKVWGMLVRLAILVSLFLCWMLSPFFLLLLFPIGVSSWRLFVRKWAVFMTPRHLMIKLMLDYCMAFLGICLSILLFPAL